MGKTQLIDLMKLFFLLLLSTISCLAQQPLVLEIQGTTASKGKVFIRIQDEKEDILKEGAFPSEKGVTPIKWTIPKRSKIAIWAFQDLNQNGELDKNALGIPTEPWGISGGKRPSLRPPLLREMWVDPAQQPIAISIR